MRVLKGRHPVAHKYPNVLIHLVFSTKERRNIIPNDLLPKLFAYLQGIGSNIRVPVIASGGTPNHMHMLIVLPSDVTLAKAVQTFKANSSRWIGEHDLEFAWQEGYGAFSVSASHRDVVRHYIEHQAEHHARRTFEEEFMTILRKCGIKDEAETVFAA